MAELNLSVKHGQTVEVARANFEKVITRAHAQHRHWIQRVEWAPDRTGATISGPGFEIALSFDAEHVHARGHVSLAVKWLEGPVRRFVEQTLRG